jgi:hypothetical protein
VRRPCGAFEDLGTRPQLDLILITEPAMPRPTIGSIAFALGLFAAACSSAATTSTPGRDGGRTDALSRPDAKACTGSAPTCTDECGPGTVSCVSGSWVCTPVECRRTSSSSGPSHDGGSDAGCSQPPPSCENMCGPGTLTCSGGAWDCQLLECERTSSSSGSDGGSDAGCSQPPPSCENMCGAGTLTCSGGAWNCQLNECLRESSTIGVEDASADATSSRDATRD